MNDLILIFMEWVLWLWFRFQCCVVGLCTMRYHFNNPQAKRRTLKANLQVIAMEYYLQCPTDRISDNIGTTCAGFVRSLTSTDKTVLIKRFLFFMYTVHCVHIIHSIHSVQYTLYTIQYTLYGIVYTILAVRKAGHLNIKTTLRHAFWLAG